jgi:predicted transcriptional regulator YdeE
MSETRTPQSDYLLQLGKQILEPYAKLPGARAAMIMGSVAEGTSDNYSDLDLSVYFEDKLPSEEDLGRIRQENGAPQRAWFIGDLAEGEAIEAYDVNGIQAQIVLARIAVWENDIAEILERFNTDTPLQKAMSGTLEAIPVFGEEHIKRWKEKIAAYPDGLRRGMVQKHLQFFPYWNIQKQLEARDAILWHYQILTESAYNMIAVLAGLNRLYFTNFQFKKMHRFLNQMTILPESFADRLEELFQQSPSDAALSLEALVREVVGLVEREMPDVDVGATKRALGKRRAPWTIPSSGTPQRIIHPIFNLIGIETRTKNALEMHPESARIGKLWERFYNEKLAEQIPNRVASGLLYGVYHKYAGNQDDAYSLVAGVEVTTLDRTPERMVGITIPEATYLVFSRTGKFPDVVMETWLEIWKYFSENTETQRAFTADFEVYHPDHLEIYVAVR